MCLFSRVCFFGFGCGFASADLSGPGCRARLRLLLWSLGVCAASPASSALALNLSPRAGVRGGQLQGSAIPRADPWLRMCVSGLGWSSSSVGETGGHPGRPPAPGPPHYFLILGLWPWVGARRDQGVTVGAHQARAKLPLAVFLLASSHRVWAPATDLRFVSVGFRWASAGEAQGTHCPLIPELIPCCGTVLPRQSQVVLGPTWSSPFLPEGLGVPTSARQGLRSPGPGPVPPLPQNMLAALGFGPSFTTLWGLCLPGIRCLACGGASPGLSPPSHRGHSVRQPVSDLAWAATCRHVMGAACGACPSLPPRGYSPGSGHVGLGYYLGSLVGFSGGLETLEKAQKWAGEKKNNVAWQGLTLWTVESSSQSLTQHTQTLGNWGCQLLLS